MGGEPRGQEEAGQESGSTLASKLPSAEGATTKAADAAPPEKPASTTTSSTTGGDDREESSSNDSKGDSGSGGSGGGYNADCSSSDTSSLDKGRSDRDGAPEVPEKRMIDLRIDACPEQDHRADAPMKPSVPALPEKETRAGAAKLSPNVEGRNTTYNNNSIGGDEERSVAASQDNDGSTGVASEPANQSEGQLDDRQHQYNDDGKSTLQDPKACLPQWNGIRIQHPMDPRIDLSTVGFVPASQLQPYPRNVNVPTLDQHRSSLFANNDQGERVHHPFHGGAPGIPLFAGGYQSLETCENGEPPPLPSMEQYMKLMEVNTKY
jgi:hypothetical protein